MHIIQKELDELAREWNCHLIRKNKYGNTKSGIPDEMYFMPQLQGTYDHSCFEGTIDYTTGTIDYLNLIEANDVDIVSQYSSLPNPPASLEFLLLVQAFLKNHNMAMPNRVSGALDVYVILVHHFSTV